MSLKENLISSFDDILATRQNIGAVIQRVYIVHRRWTGDRVGDGIFRDSYTLVDPQPQIIDLSHNLNIQAGGVYEQSDLILKLISKNKFARQDLLTDTKDEFTEKFIKVGDFFYRTKHIKEKLVTYEIHIQKVSQDETERGE